MRDVVTWGDYWCSMAKQVTKRSKDPSTQVGCVLVKDNIMISSGYNGMARGMKETPEMWNDKPTKYQYVIHAEANAVGLAAQLGRSTKGSTAYLTHFPCEPCAKVLIAAGIEKLVAPESTLPRWAEAQAAARKVLDAAGVAIVNVPEDKFA